jgi:hypothetical protein
MRTITENRRPPASLSRFAHADPAPAATMPLSSMAKRSGIAVSGIKPARYRRAGFDDALRAAARTNPPGIPAIRPCAAMSASTLPESAAPAANQIIQHLLISTGVEFSTC